MSQVLFKIESNITLKIKSSTIQEHMSITIQTRVKYCSRTYQALFKNQSSTIQELIKYFFLGRKHIVPQLGSLVYIPVAGSPHLAIFRITHVPYSYISLTYENSSQVGGYWDAKTASNWSSAPLPTQSKWTCTREGPNQV